MRPARGALSPGRASRRAPAAPPRNAPARSRDGQIVRLCTLRLNEFRGSFWIPPCRIGRLPAWRCPPPPAPPVHQPEAPVSIIQSRLSATTIPLVVASHWIALRSQLPKVNAVCALASSQPISELSEPRD